MRFVLPLLLVGCAPDFTLLERVEPYAFDAAPHRVIVDVESGNVEVLGRIDDLHDTRVEITAQWSRRPPTWDVTVEDGVLRVTSRCPGQRSCSTDVRVRVPPAVDATVDTMAGDLVIGGLVGILDASTRAGEVDLSGFRGEHVDLYTNAGTITADDVESPVVIARSAAGAVSLTLDGPLDRVVGESGAGAVTLDVPAGGYRLDLRANAGAVRLDGVHHENGSAGLLRVLADAGAIEVLGH